jgi:hypothetical protein
MKNIFARLMAVICVLVLLMSCCFTAFAKSEALIINSDITAKVGDKITYKLYLSDCETPVVGFQMYLLFDNKRLKIVDNSVAYENFSSVIYNTTLDGVVPMSWTNFSSPVNFSDKSQFFSIDFEVLKGGDCEISQFVSELYGEDMTFMKNYSFSFGVFINGQSVAENKQIAVNSDRNNVEKYQGGFINYDDGMGENSPNSSSHKAVTVDVNDSSDVDYSDIIMIVAFSVVIVALAVVMIIRKRASSKRDA